MPELTREEALAHFGVPGMRWGIRKAQTIATSKTERAIQKQKNALNNKGLIGKVALLDKYTWGGNGRFETFHNKKISELENSLELIANGKMIATTLLWGATGSPQKYTDRKLGRST